MDDRTLLERAAKAAGIPPRVVGAKPGLYWLEDERRTHLQWNPLTDDGDALRLAVKLRLRVEANAESAWAVVLGPTMEPWANEPIGSDPYAATRRAIVRAAAMVSE